MCYFCFEAQIYFSLFTNHCYVVVSRLHMMRHFGIKPHKCTMCEKSFVEASDLAKHMESRHSDDRPHTCPFCNWAFKVMILLGVFF